MGKTCCHIGVDAVLYSDGRYRVIKIEGNIIEIINYIAIGIAIGAVSVICWGVLLGLIKFVMLEIQRTKQMNYVDTIS